MIIIIITITSSNHQQYNKTYYEMTAMSKRSLISESITMIQIDIHSVGEEPDKHVVHVAPWVSRTTTVRKVPTRLKSGLCSRDEVLAPSDRPTRPSSWVALFYLH
jgi:hypothetical protein